MKRAVLSLCAIVIGSLLAGAQAEAASFEITITNVTKGQNFTPVLAATHTRGLSLFDVGSPASEELETLAEEGDTGPLTAMLLARREVFDVVTSGGLLGPGETKTFSVETRGRQDRISLAAMMIPTNDGFVALNGIQGPRGTQKTSVYALGYDAGTEDNDETCASIPGPPYPECKGPGGGAAPPGGEGVVFVHNGMHGVGDFDESMRDWRNPVARVTIRRVGDDDDSSDD